MKTKLIAGLVVLALVATTSHTVLGLAQDNLGMQPPEGNRSPVIAPQWPEGQCDDMDQLTAEEREEIQQQMQDLVQELREQYSGNLTEEEREAMEQELQTYWKQICKEYNISCPCGYRYWAAEGVDINDTIGPDRQMNERRPVAGEDGGDFNETAGQEQQSDENELGLAAKWLGGIQTFFRNLLGL
jgi:DNA-binding transcriptional MerR regulator